MGVHFVQQQRSSQKQSLKDVSTDKALLLIARKRGTRSPEELAGMEAEVHRGEFVILSGYFSDIRQRNLRAFRRVEECLRERDTKPGLLRRALTIEVEKELRCWAQNNSKLQTGYPELFHPAHLLQPELNPAHRALQLGYLHLAVLGQRANHQTQGLLNQEGEHTALLLERIHRATTESPLAAFLDLDSPAPHALASLPDEPWERGAIQSAHLDYLTDSLILAATGEGLELDSTQHLASFTEAGSNPRSYIQEELDRLGRELDRRMATE